MVPRKLENRAADMVAELCGCDGILQTEGDRQLRKVAVLETAVEAGEKAAAGSAASSNSSNTNMVVVQRAEMEVM